MALFGDVARGVVRCVALWLDAWYGVARRCAAMWRVLCGGVARVVARVVRWYGACCALVWRVLWRVPWCVHCGAHFSVMEDYSLNNTGDDNNFAIIEIIASNNYIISLSMKVLN